MTAPFISDEMLESEAIRFLAKYHPSDSIPIPIEDIVEFDLKIKTVTVPGLFSEHQIDGFLSRDNAQLFIDQDMYMNFTNRARFTIAHEMGHYILHRDYIDSLNISSIEQWKQVVLGKGTGHARLETRANTFAGMLLMPKKHLAERFKLQKESLTTRNEFTNGKLPSDSVLAPYFAKEIAKDFDVSEQAATIRLLRWIDHQK